MPRILVISATFPSSVQPTFGVFVKERVKAWASLPGYDVRVIAPVPYFPAWKRFPRWYHWSQVPRQETWDGLTVDHPRYALPPKLGGYLHARLMAGALTRAAARLRNDFPFDLVDAHYVFPAGAAATRIVRRFDVPLVVTGRGEDMLRFPRLPLVGPEIRRALREATQCVAVSREIAAAMRSEGAAPDRINVVGNGVDGRRFRPMATSLARQHLRLPADGRLIVSVGDLFENKGFHLLVQALHELRATHPDLRLAIVGGKPRFGGDQSRMLQRLIEQLGLADRVTIVGRRPHEELPYWYNAADLFALLSAREGSPNVLLEALSCGTPSIATAVGGIPDVLSKPDLGTVLPERSAAAAAAAIRRLLHDPPDRDRIHETMKTHHWGNVAERLRGVFEAALSTHGPRTSPATVAQPVQT